MEKMKALVIDDERIVLDSVSRILKEENFKVETSLSGLEGLKMAVEHSYDIVLTDLRMPDIGG
ncbi:MAG: response regulator, partial [Desulfobacterales bacterium]|nr:response regulator [Desulfobacterales bacterium]